LLQSPWGGNIDHADPAGPTYNAGGRRTLEPTCVALKFLNVKQWLVLKHFTSGYTAQMLWTLCIFNRDFADDLARGRHRPCMQFSAAGVEVPPNNPALPSRGFSDLELRPLMHYRVSISAPCVATSDKILNPPLHRACVLG